ncbi:3-oxo-tetronate kinase [Rhizobium sp. 21-4511-3d]|jgi:uncharacterized protein YgbK (DUF1537 family)
MLLGAVADDVTGATDLCLMLSREGMRTFQCIGVPSDMTALPEADAIVVALKSRTCPVDEATGASRKSAQMLLDAGAEQILFKYCSTFDSIDEGNIGQVIEVLQDLLGETATIACPAFPAAGRTIYKGRLFVGDQLLSESPMKDHPLTPMRDANLVNVLKRQMNGTVGLVDWIVVSKGPEAIKAAIDARRKDGFAAVIVDAITDQDLRTIGAALGSTRLLSGGSGIAMGLPENFRKAGKLPARTAPTSMPAPAGRQIVLAGSCSQATRQQIATAKAAGAPAIKLDIRDVRNGRQTPESLMQWALAQQGSLPPLIYSSADPEELASIHGELGRFESGAVIEETLAETAALLQQRGFRQFIIAGGETSGAVIQSLGVTMLEIGPEIDPGVPWTRSITGPDLVLALKSGNFGAPDFFLKSWALLSTEQ